jgi:hypothetical protein
MAFHLPKQGSCASSMTAWIDDPETRHAHVADLEVWLDRSDAAAVQPCECIPNIVFAYSHLSPIQSYRFSERIGPESVNCVFQV